MSSYFYISSEMELCVIDVNLLMFVYNNSINMTTGAMN